MNPYMQAVNIYGDSLINIINLCGKHGIVVSDDEVFLCAYKTHSSLIKKNIEKVLDKPDTWWVCYATGNWKKVLDIAKPLKFIGYERFDGKHRLIEAKRFGGKDGKQ
jgi:hypothetical protein